MALFTWSDQYSVKIPRIDAQHQQLVQLINDLHDAMRAGKGKDVLGPVLDELVAYTKEHFNNEEQLFAQHGYPQADTHKAAHAALVKQVVDYQQKYKSGNTFITLALMQMLKDWLIKHIQGTDKLYAPYLIERGVK